MSSRFSGPVTAVVLLTVAACAPQAQPAAQTDVAAVKQYIEAANARFLAAVQKGDTAGAVANYTDDAVVMMPNAEAWRGHDGLSKGFSGFMSQMTITGGHATTTDVMVGGDLAVETGTFEWTLQPKAAKAKAMTDKGKYLTVWKRQADGSWKIVRDINNSDLPAM